MRKFFLKLVAELMNHVEDMMVYTLIEFLRGSDFQFASFG